MNNTASGHYSINIKTVSHNNLNKFKSVPTKKFTNILKLFTEFLIICGLPQILLTSCLYAEHGAGMFLRKKGLYKLQL